MSKNHTKGLQIFLTGVNMTPMKRQKSENLGVRPTSKPKRFTLSLPDSVHSELTKIAAEKGISSKDVVIKSLKIGMLVFDAENDENKEFIIRETLESGESKETKLLII